MSAVLSEEFVKTHVVDFESQYEVQVLQLAREMHAESIAHRDMHMDEAKLITQLRTPRTNPDVYFRLAVRGEEVIGGFFGMITRAYFSDERVAKDMAWFVKKDRRGSHAAVMLVADFEAWGMQKGVKKFMLGQSTGVNVETTAALYEKLGYRVVGVNTVKEL